MLPAIYIWLFIDLTSLTLSGLMEIMSWPFSYSLFYQGKEYVSAGYALLTFHKNSRE